MQQGRLEHLNMIVSDVTKTARMLCRLFDWQIRWQGESIDAGWSAHVGPTITISRCMRLQGTPAKHQIPIPATAA